jgi:transposase InsO family protein
MCCNLARDVPDMASPYVLGSDNGDEFTDDVFTSLLREHVLTPRRNTPHTAEQNGKMEYFCGTVERVRAQNCTT